MRLLVIDRDAGFRGALLRAARTAGYQATACAQGAAALPALDTGGYDAVLLDVACDDDLALLERIRASAPGLATIAMGDEPTVERVVGALRRGARDFLRKPFAVEALERCLGAARESRAIGGWGCGKIVVVPSSTPSAPARQRSESSR